MAALRPSTISNDSFSCLPSSLYSNSNMSFQRICGSRKKFAKFEETHFRILVSVKRNIPFRSEASREYSPHELAVNKSNVEKLDNGSVLFNEMKDRFLAFKKQNYLKNLEHYQDLAKAQAPKFMVIACADSRVCPSSILGFQPGEAFVVRNVGNLVPPFENGPSETNAALEFAVNSLEVQNIFVIGHSCCGGIQALMSMQDEVDSRLLLTCSRVSYVVSLDSIFLLYNSGFADASHFNLYVFSSFISNWVIIGKNARLNTKAVAENFSFDQQCRHCEKESINCSLVNLLSYPWIEERASKGLLSIHGGYYDFINCTFEKWTLDYEGSSLKEEGHKHAIKNQEFWS